jgi:hypothetical protein
VRRIGRRVTPLERERRDLSPTLTRALDRALAPEPRERGTLEELRLVLVETLENGIARPRWPGRSRAAREPRPAEPTAMQPSPAARELPAVTPAARAPRAAPLPARGPHRAQLDVQEPDAQERAASRWRLRLPRGIWLAGAVILIGWQAFAGRTGIALLALAALVPLAVVPAEQGSSRVGVRWLSCALAPVLGLAGLAGAFPAIAGQASRWRDRATVAALGYWWLALAGPLLDRRLWLAHPSGTPARSAWETSLSLTASHVIGPLLAIGVLLGALLWAAGAIVLPWIVRGRSAALDIVAVAVWSAAIAAAAPMLDAGLSTHASHPSPRGAVLGAILGGVVAVAARALRGPV